MTPQRNARLEDLEQRFSQLESKLQDSPEKEAISVLHAMLLEIRRQQAVAGQAAEAGRGAAGPSGKDGQTSLDYVANLYKSAPPMEGRAEKEGLAVGSQAPDFGLLDATGRKVSLANYQGRNVVLAFYPLDWSPACSDQLSLYQSELPDFRQRGVQLLAISVDSLYSHGAWAAVRGITFPLLADFHPKGEVARRYNIFRETDGFSERALYIVDGDGIIRYCHVSPELHQIPDIYELFEELDKLRPERAGLPAK